MRAPSEPGCFPSGRHYPGIAHLLRIVAAGLADEFTGETSLDGLPMCVIDTELTGRDPSVDRVVEVACVLYRNGTVLLRKSWLVNPGIPIPKEAFDVHGIGDDTVKDAPPFGAIVDELFETVAGHVPMAYNAEFDRKVLSAELGRLDRALPASLPPAFRKGVEWIDPLVWARELQKLEKSRALGEVAARLGIKLEQAHRALHDAEATAHIFAAFCADSRVPRRYGALIQEQRRLALTFEDERIRWRQRG